MEPENIRLASDVFWRSAVVMTLLDVALVALLIRRIDRTRFRQLRWQLAGAAIVFWSILGLALVEGFWDAYYQHFYPPWLHGGSMLAATVPIGAGLALLFHWAAVRLPGNPVASVCLLGGLESVVEHLYGMWGFRILDIPLLQGVDPLAILAFAVPEYMFYWCVVIGAAVLAQDAGRRLSDARQGRRRTAQQ